MTRPVTISKTMTAGAATAVSLSQSPLAAGNLLINGTLASGGIATFTTQRRVLITSGGNDTGITFTIYGTNQSGNPIQQTIAGGNTTAVTTIDFKTVTRVAISGAAASTVTVGTNTVGSTPWVSVTPHIAPTNLSTSVQITGTVNYTVEYTYDDLNFTPNSFFAYQLDNVVPTPIAEGNANGITASKVVVSNDPITGARLTINSGTGSASTTFLQAGIAGN